MQYFLQCNPNSKRYQYIVPEMLYGFSCSIHLRAGLFEIGYFEECVSFYDAFCIEHDWEHVFDVPEAQINEYFYKHQHQKMFQHARTFAAVIGSYLALNNYEKAFQLYKEMDFWGVVPLRETFYHFMDVKCAN